MTSSTAAPNTDEVVHVNGLPFTLKTQPIAGTQKVKVTLTPIRENQTGGLRAGDWATILADERPGRPLNVFVVVGK